MKKEKEIESGILKAEQKQKAEKCSSVYSAKKCVAFNHLNVVFEWCSLSMEREKVEKMG